MIPILLLGVPGAGKGTQAQLLVQHYAVPLLATGDMLREIARGGSQLAAQVDSTIRHGQLVSDPIVCQIVAARLGRPDCRHGFILDGFPRTVPQAEWLMANLPPSAPPIGGSLETPRAERASPAANRSRASERPTGATQVKSGPATPAAPDPVVVVYLTVSYNDLNRRLLGRRSCPKCGRIYNDVTQPPRQAGLCDLDQAPLTLRNDDDADVLRQRLAAYEERTAPLVQFFRDRGRLLEVNGAEPVHRVSQRIVAGVDALAAALTATVGTDGIRP